MVGKLMLVPFVLAPVAGLSKVTLAQQSSWTAEEAKLVPEDPDHSASFGEAVDVSGDTAVVGATGADPLGAAYVFVRTGASWSEQQTLVASEATPSFGADVAIAGDRIVVGAGGEAAYVFERTGAHWAEKADRKSTRLNS